jgi:hypothetical protein
MLRENYYQKLIHRRFDVVIFADSRLNVLFVRDIDLSVRLLTVNQLLFLASQQLLLLASN